MCNFEALFNHVEKLSGIDLSAANKQVFMANFKPKKLRKRQYFLQQGDV